MNPLLTLCIVHQHPRVLLGMKKRGFGAGKWNGFGGKVEPGETIEQAATRELKEESGISAQDITHLGELSFAFTNKPEPLLVHVFKTTRITGEPIETDEMRPQWFTIDTIPYEHMWEDDIHWFPLFFADKKFKGKFLFDESDALLEKEIVVLS